MRRLWSALTMVSSIAALSGSRALLHNPNLVPSQDTPRQLLDRYGGSTRLRCTNKTGHFILTKLGNRWWFCTPAGNVFISMSVGNVTPNGNPTFDCKGINTFPIYAARY